MGHLINPIAFRIGHTKSWLDSWFTSNDIYPEFLHFVLKIRLFLNYQLNLMSSLDNSSSDLDKFSLFNLFSSGILYSHFKIIFDLTSVYISLFFYPAEF
jgi:hypothetical protein